MLPLATLLRNMCVSAMLTSRRGFVAVGNRPSADTGWSLCVICACRVSDRRSGVVSCLRQPIGVRRLLGAEPLCDAFFSFGVFIE
jgi:hypothetical protein